MAAFRRIPAVVLAMALFLLPTLSTRGASASTQDDLNAARAKLADARVAAQGAAAAFVDAASKQAATTNRIEQLRGTIDQQKQRAAGLQSIAAERALYAYTHKGEKLDLLVSTDSAVKAIRQTQWIDRANETDHNSI